MAFRYRSLLAVSAALIPALVAACSGSSGHSAAGAQPAIVSLSGPGPGTVPSSPAPGTATITETGSSLLFPAFARWAASYHSTYHNITVKVASTSSGTGIDDASKGNVDIGASDAFLSSGNLVQHPDLLNIPLAISAQQVNYNLPTVPLRTHLKLDGQRLAEIYSGAITRWNDPRIRGLNPGVPLPNLRIVPLHRVESAGDTFLFTSYLAASEVVSTSEPLSLAAQQMYQSLADADVTATTVILAGPPEKLSARLRYEADIANAAVDLARLRGAAGAAQRTATAWYPVSVQVFRLDNAHQYAAETARVIGTGAGSSGPVFTALVRHLRRAIGADQAVFTSNAASGSGAFGGLEVGVIIAALLMAAGSAWGLSRRLAEYR